MQLRGKRGAYTLHERLGQDGTFEHWLATGGGLRQPLSVRKLLEELSAETYFHELIHDEAALTARFDFPGVLPALDAGEDFLVTSYLPAVELSALWGHAQRAGQPIPIPIACALVRQFALTLDQVHRVTADQRPLRVVHRDLSPQSLSVAFDGRTLVTGFTMAKSALRSAQTQPGIIKGRFPYMSPEMVRGLPFDHRSDVFALGVCLYELLSGQRLFLGESDFASLERVMKCEVPELPARVPRAVDEVTRRALARDVEARTPTAGALAEDLAPFAAGVVPETLGQVMRETFPEAHQQALARAGGLASSSLDALIRGTPHAGNNR
jgi:eukaryotic-like serine/threonine-protein kinase